MQRKDGFRDKITIVDHIEGANCLSIALKNMLAILFIQA